MAMLEARPYRPFKSSEEYLEAMKEDLAEWLSTLYPELKINADNFMDRLDTGVALCQHANYVRQAAEDYLARRQARNKSMTRSMTSGLAGPILALGNVYYLPAAKSGTFFARDNVSNFITWCRKSLKIIECLLFETDDLIMRKNEKHVILCLLEVARRGAKFGMLAPMLVQMERQIDREIAADNKASSAADNGTQTDDMASSGIGVGVGVGTETNANDADLYDSDSDNEDDNDDGPMLMYGPQPQIITNDLKSLDEMVRDLVEKCTCPSQFPMVRVSEGKYRIGDTKVLIFVRILRSHVMVRVGGGWDTLSHYLDKHDPCRCRAQHRSSVGARLIQRTSNPGAGIELHKAQVIYERSPPAARRILNSLNTNNLAPTSTTNGTGGSATPTVGTSCPSPSAAVAAASGAGNSLSPGNLPGIKYRSHSPTPQRKFFTQLSSTLAQTDATDRPTGLACPPLLLATATGQSVQQPANGNGGGISSQQLLGSPSLARRSMSPSPRRFIDMRKKQSSLESANGSGVAASSSSCSGPKSLPTLMGATDFEEATGIASASLQLSLTTSGGAASGVAAAAVAAAVGGGASGEHSSNNNNNNKFENISDNGSEISDEGYRSLGVIQSTSSTAQKRESLHSQASMEDAESNARLDQTSSDSQISPTEDQPVMNKMHENKTLEVEYQHHRLHLHPSDGPQSLPAVLCALPKDDDEEDEEAAHDDLDGSGQGKFERSGIFITDDDITVDVATSTGLRKTGFSSKMFGNEPTTTIVTTAKSSGQEKPEKSERESKIPRSPLTQRRRRSIDNSTCAGAGSSGGSLQDLSMRFSRKQPVYSSVRKPTSTVRSPAAAAAGERPLPPPRTKGGSKGGNRTVLTGTQLPLVRDVTNTWSGRSTATATPSKKRPTINADTFAPMPTLPVAGSGQANAASPPMPFDRQVKTRSSHILYDSNGRRVRGGSSLTTSPVKNHASTPLAQQLLEAASSAKNDAQILEKMKALLSRYAASNSQAKSTAGLGGKKTPVYEDFTTAWVHSNGNLERSNSCSPPAKTRSKRSSAASSCESSHSRELPASTAAVSQRRERGMSKIPAPVRHHTELY